MADARMDRVLGISEPPDGFTFEEKMILQLAGEKSIADIYSMLPTSRMKALVALHFELGYGQELVAQMFGVSQEWISEEIELIRRVLLNKPDRRSKHGQPYRPRPKPQTITVEDLLKLVVALHQQ